MSSNSIDLEIEKLKIDLNNSIDSFIGEKNSDSTAVALKSKLQSVVELYVLNGVIEPGRRPIVDVNHREEISYLENIRNGFLDKVATLTDMIDYDMKIHYQNEAAVVQFRINALKDQSKDPNSIQIFLKEQYTYEPYDWNQHGIF